MQLSTKIFLISALLVTKVIVSACDVGGSDSSSSSSGSSGSSGSTGSSSSTRGSCFASVVEACVYYFDMTSSKYTEIRNGCTASPGWTDGTNSCSGMVGNSRTQLCQHTASDSKAQTYTYNLTQAQAASLNTTCLNSGGSGDILNN